MFVELEKKNKTMKEPVNLSDSHFRFLTVKTLTPFALSLQQNRIWSH